jgi:hypothetical protein
MTSTAAALTPHFPDLFPSDFFSALSLSRAETDLLASEVSSSLSAGDSAKASRASSPQRNLTLEPTLLYL